MHFSLVMYRDYPPFADYVVRDCPFTNEFDDLQYWLNNIEFQTGGYCETAISEALGVAYNKIRSREDFSHAERHVILICNSSPHETTARTFESLTCYELVAAMAKVE
jgi:pyrroloquinoline quinone (PQQ) biosynthesis protein C